MKITVTYEVPSLDVGGHEFEMHTQACACGVTMEEYMRRRVPPKHRRRRVKP